MQAAGWVGVGVALLSLYAALALELEGSESRTVLPLGRRDAAARAVAGDWESQVAGGGARARRAAAAVRRGPLPTTDQEVDVDPDRARATEAMMPVSRTLTAIVARTLTEVGQEITVPQLRVLVLLNSRGPLRLSTIAEHLDVNPSNASRTCDQLASAGKVTRGEDENDRRSVVLTLSDDGSRFVADLMTRRRQLVDGVVARMSPADRRALATGLEAFSVAVASAPPDEIVGLPDGRLIPWLL